MTDCSSCASKAKCPTIKDNPNRKLVACGYYITIAEGKKRIKELNKIEK